MALIGRRQLLAAGGATLAGLSAGASAARAAGKSKIVFISDTHIGDNTPTTWYQAKHHQAYLSALIDHVIAQASQVAEVVILGDFVDFWVYPPDRRPPSFAQIAAANPAMLGPGGKFAQLLTALEGRVTLVAGNHDMGITQADLNLLRDSRGRSIRLASDGAYLPAAAGGRIVCGHGHESTIFNAPDHDTGFAPLPAAHFICRAVAWMMSRRLGPGRTVAELPGQGAPNSMDISALAGAVDANFVTAGFNYIQKATGMPWDEPIILPDGRITSLAQGKAMYATLWARWTAKMGGGLMGQLETAKSAYADADGTYLSWFAQKLALETGADLTVFGHTHRPVAALKEGFTNYLNTGFNCMSIADLPAKRPTFVESGLDGQDARLMQVRAVGSSHVVEPYDLHPVEPIVYPPNLDYSTYVTIDNRAGASDLTLVSARADQGLFIVPPISVIGRGTVGRLWVQDRPGVSGTAGTVVYRDGAGREHILRFGCPTGVAANFASGAPFRSRSAGGGWGAPNQPARLGHPHFVEFRF